MAAHISRLVACRAIELVRSVQNTHMNIKFANSSVQITGPRYRRPSVSRSHNPETREFRQVQYSSATIAAKCMPPADPSRDPSFPGACSALILSDVALSRYISSSWAPAVA